LVFEGVTMNTLRNLVVNTQALLWITVAVLLLVAAGLLWFVVPLWRYLLSQDRDEDMRRDARRSLLMVILSLAAAAISGYAIGRGRAPAPEGAYVFSPEGAALLATVVVILCLGACVAVFLRLVVRAASVDDTVVESHWGGFGGGLGGWRVSPAILYLTVAVCFGALLTTVTLRLVRSPARAEVTTAVKPDSGRTK
jgi:hypothetical protein